MVPSDPLTVSMPDQRCSCEGPSDGGCKGPAVHPSDRDLRTELRPFGHWSPPSLMSKLAVRRSRRGWRSDGRGPALALALPAEAFLGGPGIGGEGLAEVLGLEHLAQLESTGASSIGQRFTHSSASSRDVTWIMVKPAMSSLVSANGPSVTSGVLPPIFRAPRPSRWRVAPRRSRRRQPWPSFRCMRASRRGAPRSA